MAGAGLVYDHSVRADGESGSSDLDGAVGRQSIAVLVPCYNEALTIGAVVAGFQDTLAHATIYVYDNNSTDETVAVAKAAGAVVRSEGRQGKGNVVRRMFADVDADVYVMVDGDGTYDPASAPDMVARLLEHDLDMVVGVRVATQATGQEYRSGHALGNRAFSWLLRQLFPQQANDVFSGYRVFSRRFVKTFPAVTTGFDIETELTAHVADLGAPIDEIETVYIARPAGSDSKLSTYRDGLRILRRAIVLYKEFRPLRFFMTLAAACTVIALVLGIPIIAEFRRTGLVPRYPTAFLAASLQVMAVIFATAGVMLDSVARLRIEHKRLAYLAIPLRRC